MDKNIAESIKKEAEDLLASDTSAIEFSEKFFGVCGRLRELTKKREDRDELVASPLYKWLQSVLADLRDKEAKRFNQEIIAKNK